MDYCSKVNQIGNYAPSCGSGGVDPFVVKNIDCVTLEANSITTSALTINGNPIDDILTNISTKTQYQTATSTPYPTTSFSGQLVADNIIVNDGFFESSNFKTNTLLPYTSGITFNTGIVVNGSVSCKTSLLVNDTASSGDVVAQFLQPSLGSATSTIEFGKDSTSSNCGEIFFNRDAVTTANTHCGIRMKGYVDNGIKIYSDKVVFPKPLYIGSSVTQVVPRYLQTLNDFGPSAITYTIDSTLGIKRVVISFSDWKKLNSTSTTIAVPRLTFTGSGGATVNYAGISVGNNTGQYQYWGSSYIPLWNNTTYPATATYVYNGIIELTSMGIITGAGERWNITGNIAAYNPDNLAGADYYCHFNGSVSLTAVANSKLASIIISRQSGESTIPATGYGKIGCMFA